MPADHCLSFKQTKERLCRYVFGCSHNKGHVSRSELRRVLARVGILLAAPLVRALEARYLDDSGFSYVRLLEEVIDHKDSQSEYYDDLRSVDQSNFLVVSPESIGTSQSLVANALRGCSALQVFTDLPVRQHVSLDNQLSDRMRVGAF